MRETAMWLGGFVRWLLKVCKRILQDEVKGNFDATWGGSYNTENYIIGVVTVIIIFGIVLPLVF